MKNTLTKDLFHLFGGKSNSKAGQSIKRRFRLRQRKRIVAVEALEQRRLLATVTWINPLGGDWDDAANWSDGTVNRLPGTGDDVVIPDVSADEINIQFSSGSVAIDSLTSEENLSITGGTLDVAGDLSVQNKFNASNATLANARITTGTTLILVGGTTTLRGVTLDSDLKASPPPNPGSYLVPQANIRIVDGLTLNGTVRLLTEPNTIANLIYSGTQTLDGSGTLLFPESTFRSTIRPGTAASSLTVGSGITIRGQFDIGYSYSTSASAGTFINRGSILQDLAGGEVNINVSSFDNQGTISQQGSGGSVVLRGNWANAGRLESTAADGTLVLTGNFTSDLGDLRGLGNITLAGTIDNAGRTLAPTAATGDLALSGLVRGGIVQSENEGVSIVGSSLNLDDVIWSGDFGDLATPGYVGIQNTVEFNGTLSVRRLAALGSSNYLVGNASIVFPEAPTSPYSSNSLIVTQDGASLTIGPNVTVQGHNYYVGHSLYGGGSQSAAIINGGKILADQAGSKVTIFATGFQHQGTGTIQVAHSGAEIAITGSFDSGLLSAAHNSAGGQLAIAGNMDNSANTVLDARLPFLTLREGGTIKGGTISGPSDSVMYIDDHPNRFAATLDGVTLDVDVNMAQSSELLKLQVRNGLTLNRTLSLGGTTNTEYSELLFSGSQQLVGSGTILFGSSQFNGITANASFLDPASVLTIGSEITVQNGRGTLDAVGSSSIVNRGTILAGAAGSEIRFRGNTQNETTGVLRSTDSGKLYLLGNWTNRGTIDVQDTGSLFLGGSFSTADLGIIQRAGGVVNLVGTLNNTGNTLHLNDETGSWNFGRISSSVYESFPPGAIIGGTVSTSGSAKLIVTQNRDLYAYAFLDGVTFGGSLHVEGGPTPNGFIVGGTLDVKNSLTLDKASITLGNSKAHASLAFSGPSSQLEHHLSGNGSITFQQPHNDYRGSISATSSGASLVIGPGIAISGSYGTIGSATTKFRNQGTIVSAALKLNGAGWRNEATIEARGGTIWAEGSSDNFQDGTLSGGSWRISAGGTLRLINSGITTNAADILISGPNSRFLRDLASTSAFASTWTNASSGLLVLTRSASLEVGTMVNEGQVFLYFDTSLHATSYTQRSGFTQLDFGHLQANAGVAIESGLLWGRGTVQADVTNAGRVSPGFGYSYGTLTIAGNYTQTVTGTATAILAGTDPEQYEHDRLIIIGAVELDGLLSLRIDESFTPNEGDAFRVLSFGSRSGDFANYDIINRPDFKLAPSFDATGLTFTYVAINSEPVAHAGGPYSVSEDASLQLGASGTTDPDQDPLTLSYQWDLDGDGIFGETGTDAPRGDEVGVSPTFSALHLAAATEVTVSLLVTDNEGLTSDVSTTITVLAADPADLDNVVENVISSGETEVELTADDANIEQYLDAVELLEPNPYGNLTITLVLSGTIEGQTVSVPEGYTLVIDGSDGQTVFEGASPALTVMSGEVIVKSGVTFINSTNAPTILVTGGSLTLQDAIVRETTGGNQAAILITGGTVDLGTAADAGGNTFEVLGAGEAIRNNTITDIPALGNTFYVDGMEISDPFVVEEDVYHALDDVDLGLVSFVAGNVAPRATIDTLLPAEVTVGETVAFSGIFADVGSIQTHSAVWTVQSHETSAVDSITGVVDEQLSSGSVTADYVFPAPGNYTLTLEVIDEGGLSGIATTTLTVNNVAPTLAISGPTTANEGETKGYTFTTSDPGNDTFVLNGITAGPDATVSSVVFDTNTGTGSFDMTFHDGPGNTAIAVQLEDSNGAAASNSGMTALDTTFGDGGTLFTDVRDDGLADIPSATTIQPDGKVLVAGWSRGTDGDIEAAVVRYNVDGTLDSGFGIGGAAVYNFGGYIPEIHVLDDGKILVRSDQALIRLNADGTPDTTFGTVHSTPDGVSYGRVVVPFPTPVQSPSIVVMSNGQIVVAGIRDNGDLTANGNTTTDFDLAFARYDADGTADTSFGTSGVLTLDLGGSEDRLTGLILDTSAPEGDRPIAYGERRVYNPTAPGRTSTRFVVRLDVDGNLDNTFGDGDGVWQGTGFSVAAAAVGPAGKVVLGGWKSGFNDDFHAARLTADGSELDAGFGISGTATIDFDSDTDRARDIEVDAAGRVILVGQARSDGRDFFAVARFNEDGTPDNSFSDDGKDLLRGAGTAARAAAISGGSIVLAGEGLGGGFHVARYATGSLTVAVANVAPTVAVDAASVTVDEGSTALNTGTFSDPGTDIVTLTASVGAVVDNGDGTWSWSWDTTDGPDDSQTVTITATDEDGSSSTVSQSITVTNVVPQLQNVAITSTTDENEFATLSGTIVDPAVLDTFTLTIDWGDGTVATFNYGAGTTSFSETHQYLDDGPNPGDGMSSHLYTIGAKVTDDDGGVAENTSAAMVTVNNLAPVVDPLVLESAIIDENGGVSVSGTFTDPGTLDTHEVVIDWGDGSSATVINLALGARSFSATHQYLDDGPTGTPRDDYTISATVTDDDSGVGSNTETVTVNNVAPVITTFTTDSPYYEVADENEMVTARLDFTDPGLLDTHDVIIDWGDGNSETIQLTSGERTLSPTHAYTTGGVFNVTVSVEDNDTDIDFGSATVVVTGVGVVGHTLYVVGTGGADRVHINGQGGHGLKVHSDFFLDGEHRTFSTADIDRIVVELLGGDDHLTTAGNVHIPLLARAGSENDRIHLAGGPAVVVGGVGSDDIQGGAGRNMLIGGLGANTLKAGRGGDVLVAGATELDDDNDALFDLLERWNSNASAADRMEEIIETLAGKVIEDDEAVNTLHSGAGHDLFFADLNDLLKGNKRTYTVVSPWGSRITKSPSSL